MEEQRPGGRRSLGPATILAIATAVRHWWPARGTDGNERPRMNENWLRWNSTPQ